jgi:hypothetical protein
MPTTRLTGDIGRLLGRISKRYPEDASLQKEVRAAFELSAHYVPGDWDEVDQRVVTQDVMRDCG